MKPKKTPKIEKTPKINLEKTKNLPKPLQYELHTVTLE
jgi:hypothetical protein